MPLPGSNAGYKPSEHVMPLIVLRKPYQQKLFEESDTNQRFAAIASNRDGAAEEIVGWYNQRGETSENRIKELKIGFGMERMPCGELEANAVFFRIGVLAYNLFEKEVRARCSKLAWGYAQAI